MRMLVLAVLFLAQRPSSLPFQAGTITGRLLNADGSPASKVRVSAMAIPETRNGGTDAPALITLTETDTTGRYRLADVPIGRYYIVAGFVDSPTYYPKGTGPAGATPVSVTARAVTANIDFQIEKPSTGLSVSGRVIIESTAPFFGNVQVMLNGAPGGSYTNQNVPAKLDGSFEFVRLRPGTYTLSVTPAAFFQPRTLVVGEKDVTGLELRIPWTGEVRGKAVVEGGDPVPTFTVSFTGGIRPATSYQSNQAFQATLTEGFYGVSTSGIPSGFYVKSITAGATNLLTDPLRVSPAGLPPEILVTLGVSTPSPWVRLSGRITSSQPSTTSTLTLNGPIGSLQASVSADGSFEFPKVLPGLYTAYTNPAPIAAQPITIVVPNRDLTGVVLALPKTKEITGRISVEDGGPLPRPMLMMTFTEDKATTANPAVAPPSLAQLLVTSANVRSGQTAVNLNIQQDGTFKAFMPEGQYQLTANISSGTAPPYVLKTFTYGTTDLTKNPLKVTSSDSGEIRMTFAPTSQGTWAKVSGRVVGLNSLATPVPASVAMNNPSFLAPLTTPVRADGTFEFLKVYSGTYQARLIGTVANVGVSNLDVNVAGSDITNLEFVVPRQKEILGRITLEGRGPMPQFNIQLIPVPSNSGVYNTGPVTILNVTPSSSDGVFKLTLSEGERHVGRPTGLPPGYALKSLIYGSTDLAKAPFKISATDTAELRITISTPDQPPVKLSGKVSGLDPSMFARGPINVSLNAPGYAVALTTQVSPDGSFEFPAVFPGNYTARLAGSVANGNLAAANVTVAGSDVTGVEIVLPRQR